MKKVEAWVYVDEHGNRSPILFKYCVRCGRRLKTEAAQMRGYGETCWKKICNSRQTTLF